MLFKLAWRNIWRNKKRSLIILTSIAVGVAAALLQDAIGRGFSDQMLKNQIELDVAHVQIHKKGFENDKDVKNVLPNASRIEKKLREFNFIASFCKRVKGYGLAGSANSSSGAEISGVDSRKEIKVTELYRRVEKGAYLKNDIDALIGEKLAKKLEVQVGDKIVLTAADSSGKTAADLFRICGIFKTGDSKFDKGRIYITLKKAQRLFGIGDAYHEIAIKLKDPKKIDYYKKTLRSEIKGDYEVLSYKELLPTIMLYLDLYEQIIGVMYAAIAIAVIFGVVNIVLMSVFERANEIGVLMAIGMKPAKIFKMVLTEAFALGAIGSVFGLALGLAIYYPFSVYGLDLSVFAESLSSYGVGSVIYPTVNAEVFFYSLIFIPITAIIGAIYPARKAIKMRPTDAMRYV